MDYKKIYESEATLFDGTIKIQDELEIPYRIKRDIGGEPYFLIGESGKCEMCQLDWNSFVAHVMTYTANNMEDLCVYFLSENAGDVLEEEFLNASGFVSASSKVW